MQIYATSLLCICLSCRTKLGSFHKDYIMLKSFACWFIFRRVLMILLIWTTIETGFLGIPLRANDAPAPTQQHQQVFLADYFPSKRGLTVQGTPLVRVKLNGIQDAVFLVDTGTTFSVISAKMAKQMRLSLKPTLNDDGKPIIWKGKPTLMATVDSEIGKFTFKACPLVVVEAKDFVVADAAPDNAYDGVIGMNYLQHMALLMDNAQHKLGFCLPGALTPEQLRQTGFPEPYVIPIVQQDIGWFAQAIFTDGGLSGTGSLLVDTGAAFSGVSLPLAQRLQLKTLGQEKQINADGTNVVSRTSVSSLVVGSLALSNVSMLVHPTPKGDPSLHVADPSSSIGMDILSKYRVMLDFPGGKMYLQPLPPPVHTITIGPGAAPPPAPAP